MNQFSGGEKENTWLSSDRYGEREFIHQQQLLWCKNTSQVCWQRDVKV